MGPWLKFSGHLPGEQNFQAQRYKTVLLPVVKNGKRKAWHFEKVDLRLGTSIIVCQSSGIFAADRIIGL
jgi:hypothetical protein